MVSSPMYDRLMKFVEGVEESYKLRNYDSEHHDHRGNGGHELECVPLQGIPGL